MLKHRHGVLESLDDVDTVITAFKFASHTIAGMTDETSRILLSSLDDSAWNWSAAFPEC